MNKNLILGVAAVVIAGAAFWGGMAYGKSATPARGQFGGAGSFTRAGGATGGTMGARGGMGGFVGGQIIARDASSITVKMQNGNTAIILVATSTDVTKSVSGSAADLSVGANVVVTGAQNSDGSITAQSVQIRPTGAAPVRTQ